MALASDVNDIVSKFDFSDQDINSHVTEFLKQMSASPRCSNSSRAVALHWVTFAHMSLLLQRRVWSRMAPA